MEPEEEGALPDRFQPRLRLVNQSVSGGKLSKGVDALRWRGDRQAVPEVQFVVERAEPERSCKSFDRSI